METSVKQVSSSEVDRQPQTSTRHPVDALYGQAKKVVKRAAESERQRVVTKQQWASLDKVDEEVALGQKAEMAREKAPVEQSVAECRPSHPFALAEARRCSTQQSRGAVDKARRAAEQLAAADYAHTCLVDGRSAVLDDAADCAAVNERSPTERVASFVDRLFSILGGACQFAKVLCGRVDAAADPPPIVKTRRPRRVRQRAAEEVDTAPTVAEQVVRRGRPSASWQWAVQQGYSGAVASAVAGRAVARPKRRRAAAKEVTAAVEVAPSRPKRQRKAVNYAEVEHALDCVVEVDRSLDSIYCFKCEKGVVGGCVEHEMVFVDDKAGVCLCRRFVSQPASFEVEQGTDNYARRSCPDMVSVAKSRRGGLGVWTDRLIPAGHYFGPYKGERKWFAEPSRYMWQIGRLKDADHFFVDAQSENWGNYLRFINHDEPHLCNMRAFEMDRQVWYVTTKEVRLGVELIVSYGSQYARYINVHFKKPPAPVYDLSGVFACVQCSDGFSSAALLDAHVKRRHPAEPKAARKQAASGEKRHRCSTCAYATDKLGNLRDHERVHTGERPFACAQCPAVFAQATALKDHSRTHTGERPFACTDCGKVFSVKSHLSRHRRLDEGVKLYKCEHCDERFTVSHHLTKHLRLHTGERPFACTDCGKVFSVKSHLSRHRLLHEGVKTFKCEHCDERFTQSANLTVHLRVHTGEKPFACSFCPKSFAQSSHCRRHEKTQHPP